MSLVQMMTLKQLESCVDLPEQTYASDLLPWFVSKNESKVHSDEFIFSGKRIYRFCANITGIEGMSGFGRSQDEMTAAVKACAEALERKIYGEFLKQNGSLNLQIQQTLSGMKIESNDHPKQINPSFQNSNGWAVGFSSLASIERAKVEALERHLLLLTFIKDGWNGFYEISRTTVDGIEFTSLLSRYTLAGYSAGIGIARSEKFKGASFGYICDKIEDIKTSPKWEQVFYESFDYIRVRSAQGNLKSPQSLIFQELEHYLENDFSEKFSTNAEFISLGESFNSNLAVIDLAKMLNLKFPFFAAVVHGQDLLPLYFKKSLTVNGENILKERLLSFRIFETIPDRHPIL